MSARSILSVSPSSSFNASSSFQSNPQWILEGSAPLSTSFSPNHDLNHWTDLPIYPKSFSPTGIAFPYSPNYELAEVNRSPQWVGSPLSPNSLATLRGPNLSSPPYQFRPRQSLRSPLSSSSMSGSPRSLSPNSTMHWSPQSVYSSLEMSPDLRFSRSPSPPNQLYQFSPSSQLRVPLSPPVSPRYNQQYPSF